MSDAPPSGAFSGVSIAIVDDHQLLTAALGAALRAEGHSVTIAELTSLEDVTAQLTEAKPAVALLDLDLGALGSGEDLIAPLRQLEAFVIVISGTSDEAVIGRCLERGAADWVPKSARFDELFARITDGAAGGRGLRPAERERLLDAWRARRRTDADAAAPFARLTPREAAVLASLMDGASVERIATSSFVSEATVRTQVRGILTKLAVKSQLEAVALANRLGWRPPASDSRGPHRHFHGEWLPAYLPPPGSEKSEGGTGTSLLT